MKSSKRVIKQSGKKFAHRWLGLVWNQYIKSKSKSNVLFEYYIKTQYDLNNYY